MYYVIYRNHKGYWYWSLVSTNHKAIANSAEWYWHKHNCLNSIGLAEASYNAPVYER
ncbi:MAG TPA: DUF1508 domain-containing protein [Gammaproteobacteria bacterium]|nr:DUF1508 domain-containing protein [Gammaproteobacteria bacterium]